MKTLFIFSLLVTVWLVACHETTIGYLNTENASYEPDTMRVRKTLDPKLDAIRIKNEAPWVSLILQGYEGTEFIHFSVESVKSSLGDEAVSDFKKNLTIRGGGALMYPVKNNAKPGTYLVSIRLTNEGYSHVLEDAMTIIVTE